MKKFIMAFATMLFFSVAGISQINLSEHTRSATLQDGTIVVTYDNKPDKHLIRSNDGINFIIYTVGRTKIIRATIIPDNAGNRNVTIGNIKYTVNSSGYVKFNTTNNYNSLTGTNSCVGDYIRQCQQEWACNLVCSMGFRPQCLFAWAIACAVSHSVPLDLIPLDIQELDTLNIDNNIQINAVKFLPLNK